MTDTVKTNGEATDITLSDAWRDYLRRRQEPHATVVSLTLPSGMAVRATRPNLLLLLRTGRIPDTLTPRVESLIAKSQEGGEAAAREEMHRRHRENPAAFFAEWRNLLEVVWCEAVAEPRFTQHPERDAALLPVSQVDNPDLEYLFVWCQGVTEDVATFLGRRAGAGALVGPGPAGDAVPPRPAGDARDRYEG
jgi:hypothetical protein